MTHQKFWKQQFLKLKRHRFLYNVNLIAWKLKKPYHHALFLKHLRDLSHLSILCKQTCCYTSKFLWIPIFIYEYLSFYFHLLIGQFSIEILHLLITLLSSYWENGNKFNKCYCISHNDCHYDFNIKFKKW